MRLKRVSGEISGATVNGGIDVEMAGMVADWRQMDLKTNNGGITVAMPAQYSANVQAETGQGRIQSDFPCRPLRIPETAAWNSPSAQAARPCTSPPTTAAFISNASPPNSSAPIAAGGRQSHHRPPRVAQCG